MSCAKVNCNSRFLAAAQRNKCCKGKSGQPTKQPYTPSKDAPGPSDLNKPLNKVCRQGENIVDCIGRTSPVVGGSNDISDKTQAEKDADKKNNPPPEDDDPDSDLREEDKDCTDFLSDIPIIGDLVPKKWREEGCRTGKGITKGYDDCAGLGIPCGELIVMGLALVVLTMIISFVT